MSDKDFCIAHLTEQEKEQLRAAEEKFKADTGKNCVLIAWEGKA